MAVYLLRHARSVWQDQYEIESVDPWIPDAPLSEAGRAQIGSGAAAVRHLNLDLAVTSPLTRAIQTALGVLTGSGVPIVVHPLIRERFGDSCDMGRPPSALAGDFPLLDFGHLEQTWWYAGKPDARGRIVEPWTEVEARCLAFAEWLGTRSEANILVVSHKDFLRRFGGTEIGNCEVQAWKGLPGRLVSR